MGVARLPSQQRAAVEITFAVRDGRGYQPGSEVSERLRRLSLVEFSFFVGFPTLQIAERKTPPPSSRFGAPSVAPQKPSVCLSAFHYPELNTSHHLRHTWVRTGEDTPGRLEAPPGPAPRLTVCVLQSCWTSRSSS